MNNRLKILLPAAVLLAGAIAIAVLVMTRKRAHPVPARALPPLVRVLKATPTNLQFLVHSQGTVTPRSQITLAAEVSGRVLSISAAMADGGYFEKDEILATIESRDFELAVVRAQAQVAEAEASLSREQAEAELARKEWDTLGNGTTAPPLVLRAPQLLQATAHLEAARATLELAGRDLERTRVRAPFAGRVLEKLVDAGQFVNRGTAMGRVYATDFVEVRLPVPSEDLAYLDLPVQSPGEAPTGAGPEVVLQARFAGTTSRWTGQIIRTEGEIDSRSRMATLIARIADPFQRKVGTGHPPIALGLFVQAEIPGRTKTNLFALPRTALRDDGRVLVVDENLKLRFREVVLARSESDTIVVESGIASGEQICLSPLTMATEGQDVRVVLETVEPATPNTPGGTR